MKAANLSEPLDVVLVLAAVDAVAGVYLLSCSIREGRTAARCVGGALLISAMALGSTPCFADNEPLPAVGRSARV